MSDKLDVSYFKKNLEVILSSITYYTAEEMERTLLTLAAVLAADKPDFDITKHEWNDPDIKRLVVKKGESVWIGFEREVIDTIISKADSIAIAKALGVTAEDLS